MASIGITARYLSGAALATVAVPTHSTIAELKAEITHIAKLEAGIRLQQLIFNGSCLEDAAPLEDVGLTDGSDVVPVCVPIIPIDGEFFDDYDDGSGCRHCGCSCGCYCGYGDDQLDNTCWTIWTIWTSWRRRNWTYLAGAQKVTKKQIASAAATEKALEEEDIYNESDDQPCDWWNDTDLDRSTYQYVRCPSLCGGRWAKKALRKATALCNQRVDRWQWPGRALYSQELRKQRETLQVMCDRLHRGCAKLQREFREQERAFKTMLETLDDDDDLRLVFPRKLAERMNKSKENIEHLKELQHSPSVSLTRSAIWLQHLKAQLLQQQARVDHCQAELRRMDETEVRSPSQPKQHFALQASRIKKQVAQRDAKRKLAASRIASKHKQQVRLERRCAKHLLQARFAEHLDHD